MITTQSHTTFYHGIFDPLYLLLPPPPTFPLSPIWPTCRKRTDWIPSFNLTPVTATAVAYRGAGWGCCCCCRHRRVGAKVVAREDGYKANSQAGENPKHWWKGVEECRPTPGVSASSLVLQTLCILPLHAKFYQLWNSYFYSTIWLLFPKGWWAQYI